MKFVREGLTSTTIRHVEPGRIVVGDETVERDLLLFRQSIETDWNEPAGSLLDTPVLSRLIEARPEIVIYGCGWQAELPPREVVFLLAKKGIGFETMDTPAACRTYNILIGEDRDVAALLKIR